MSVIPKPRVFTREARNLARGTTVMFFPFFAVFLCVLGG